MARNAVDRLEARPEPRMHRDERDPLPEHAVYRDEGCGNGCVRSLECPFPRCRYDDPLLWQRIGREERAQAVLAARDADGLPPEALAERFGISRRTVYRILAQARQDRTEEVA